MADLFDVQVGGAGWHFTAHLIAIAALFVACFAITGYITFRDDSIPGDALKDQDVDVEDITADTLTLSGLLDASQQKLGAGVGSFSQDRLISLITDSDLGTNGFLDFRQLLADDTTSSYIRSHTAATHLASKFTGVTTNPANAQAAEILGTGAQFGTAVITPGIILGTDDRIELYTENKTTAGAMAFTVANGSATAGDRRRLIVFTRECLLGNNNLTVTIGDDDDFVQAETIAYVSKADSVVEQASDTATGTEDTLTIGGAAGTKILPGSFIYFKESALSTAKVSYETTAMFLIGGANATVAFSQTT